MLVFILDQKLKCLHSQTMFFIQNYLTNKLFEAVKFSYESLLILLRREV